jgi:hypothetical protein
VRFFSKDAYRTFSPEVSVYPEQEREKENEELGFRDQSTPVEGRKKVGSGFGIKKRPSVAGVFEMLNDATGPVFSPLEEPGNLGEGLPEAPSLMKPLPSPDLSNIFNMSHCAGMQDSVSDPFNANATTYYTPQVMDPDSPMEHMEPNGKDENGREEKHVRTASKEEDMMWSLTTQLTLQQELCKQYEIDLNARDELVESLEMKLEAVEREGEKRKGVVRVWKKKVAELEKSVRGLEEEVERGKETSLERSIMDEASGEALRMLHRQIGRLEREKEEWEKREKHLVGEVEDLKREMETRHFMVWLTLLSSSVTDDDLVSWRTDVRMGSVRSRSLLKHCKNAKNRSRNWTTNDAMLLMVLRGWKTIYGNVILKS